MNEEIFSTVLNEILDELKESNQSLKTLQTTVKELQTTTAGFEQKLTDQQVIAPPADTTAIQELTGTAIAGMQEAVKTQLDAARCDTGNKMDHIASIVEAQPKAVVKQWRLSFFPDHDINGSFRHLINKCILALICIVLIGACYSLGLHYIEMKDAALRTDTPPTEKKRLDTLYKKYMHKKSDGSYEFR